MNAETIINGKRLVLKGAPLYVEVAVPDTIAPRFYDEYDPRRIEPVTIRKQRHRLVRLVAEYELESESKW